MKESFKEMHRLKNMLLSIGTEREPHNLAALEAILGDFSVLLHFERLTKHTMNQKEYYNNEITKMEILMNSINS